MVEGNNTGLADHFQTLDWLLLELEKSKNKFLQLQADKPRSPQARNFHYLASCAEEAWQKAEKYYNKADETAAYYAAIVLNPTLKMQWFTLEWGSHKVKKEWISTVEQAVRELWVEYKGKGKRQPSSSADHLPQPAPLQPKDKTYTSARNHKRLKITHEADIAAKVQEVDPFDDYISTNCILLKQDEQFDAIQYWYNRLTTQPELAQFALDILAIPPMSDDCERLFSSAKILLEDRRSRLRMDIIEANECLRHSYGPPQKGTFDSEDIGEVEGEPQSDRISPSQASKLRVTAYEKAQAEAAAVQLINEDEDNEDGGEDRGKDEALEVEFTAIEAILDQGNDTDDGDENREVNEDNK